MLERIRHPELCEFIDEIQNAVTQFGPTGTDVPEVAGEKRANLDEMLPRIVSRNSNSAQLDRMRRREQAVRWAGRRSGVLRTYVERALLPPALKPQVGPTAPKMPKTPLVEEPVAAGPSNKTQVQITEKPERGGFIADVSMPNFCDRYIKGNSHKAFKALGREWRVELQRDKIAKQKPGFWLTLIKGKPFTASFAFTVQGPEGSSEGQHTRTETREWIPGGDAAGWGYSWERFNVELYDESTGTSHWVDNGGTLRVRLDLTRDLEPNLL